MVPSLPPNAKSGWAVCGLIPKVLASVGERDDAGHDPYQIVKDIIKGVD